jgi:hypothetical protein
MSIRIVLIIAGALAIGAVPAYGKLPPPSEEQKLKAEEAKAKAAEQAKKDAEILSKAQDDVAGRYIQQMKAKGVEVKPTPIAPPAAAAPAAVPAQAQATAGSPPPQPSPKQ